MVSRERYQPLKAVRRFAYLLLILFIKCGLGAFFLVESRALLFREFTKFSNVVPPHKIPKPSWLEKHL